MLNKLQLSSLITSVLLLPILAYIVHKRQDYPVNYSINDSINYPVFDLSVFFNDNFDLVNDGFSDNNLAGDIIVFHDEVAHLNFARDDEIQTFAIRPLETNVFYQYSNSIKDCGNNTCDVSIVNLD